MRGCIRLCVLQLLYEHVWNQNLAEQVFVIEETAISERDVFMVKGTGQSARTCTLLE